MDGAHVVEPQRQVGQVLGFLHFTAQSFSLFLIHFHANLIRERVDARVAVVSAVGTVGREAFRREGKLKKMTEFWRLQRGGA